MIEELQAPAVDAPRHAFFPDKVTALGKYFFAHEKKFWVKGVTYGTFRPRNGHLDYDPSVVETDFALMRRNHINAIRIYTIPPRWMLDLAQQNGLRLLIGFPWEEHVAFLDQASTKRSIRQRLRASLRELAGHPAILSCAIGNEIPSGIVRWHGPEKIQRHLKTLYETAKDCDPDLLVTYVNYPSTEYLHLPFLDFFSFNVFLQSRSDFRSYLLRLQNLAGEKPLLLTEIGLDSRRNDLEKQARLLRSQIWSTFRSGCAGLFVYSWTDEWFRGGADVDDWDFGLTTRDRRPKPALDTVRKQFAKVPFRSVGEWPKISVVVCSYNGSKTIEQCLQALMRVDYDNHEVIVIDDGSTDSTASIASKFPVRLIRTPNRGLSAARNRGLTEATGEIIAYIDDDAYPDSNWLHYLATAFQETTYACIGGPNLPPSEDGFMAQCVAHSPGGPIHVLLSDDEAEHVPGCNLSIRKEALQSIGGFDTQFRVAGDDVDVCWRLQQAGFKIGYHPGAVVWHHRRNSLTAYLRQQRGYGKAEVLLAQKWPEKYNIAGHVSWAGRIYQNGFFSAGRIYSGIWGTAPFQSLYQRSYGVVSSMTHMPEWVLLIILSFLLTGLGFLWPPLKFAAIFLVAAILFPVVNAIRFTYSGIQLSSGSKLNRLKTLAVSSFLYCAQPVARFAGRWPLWRPSYKKFVLPFKRNISVWSERWQDPAGKLTFLLDACKKEGAIVSHGDAFSHWDLEAVGGAFGRARLSMVVEEHGQGKQMTRFRISAHSHWIWIAIVCSILSLSAAAVSQSAWMPALVLSGISIALGVRLFLECGRAMSALIHAIRLFEAKTNG